MTQTASFRVPLLFRIQSSRSIACVVLGDADLSESAHPLVASRPRLSLRMQIRSLRSEISECFYRFRFFFRNNDKMMMMMASYQAERAQAQACCLEARICSVVKNLPLFATISFKEKRTQSSADLQ